jgi:hypothetical protein
VQIILGRGLVVSSLPVFWAFHFFYEECTRVEAQDCRKMLHRIKPASQSHFLNSFTVVIPGQNAGPRRARMRGSNNMVCSEPVLVAELHSAGEN